MQCSYQALVRRHVLHVCLVGAMTGACAPYHDSASSGEDAHGTEDIADGGSCPPEDCGINGTELASRRFGQLSLDGVDNERGFAIVDLLDRDGRHLMLDVVDGELVGVDPDLQPGSGVAATRGARLIDSRLIVTRDEPDGAAVEWQLVIESMGAAPFMSNERGLIPTYRISAAPVADPDARRPLCPDDAMAMVVKGERHDVVTLAIQAGERWFQLACEGHLLWKSKQMSYDPERSPDDPYHTTVGQRRATLAMLAADYCGTGRRFTTPGTPIYWQNRARWMVTGGSPGKQAAVEAGWNEHGATCLGTPRHQERYARADIEAVCGRPLAACTPEILARSEWVTWTP